MMEEYLGKGSERPFPLHNWLAQSRFLFGWLICIHAHIHYNSESRHSICVLFTLISFLSLPVGLFFLFILHQETLIATSHALGDGGITAKKTFETRCKILY